MNPSLSSTCYVLNRRADPFLPLMAASLQEDQIRIQNYDTMQDVMSIHRYDKVTFKEP